MKNPELIKLFAVVLLAGIGIAAAQNSTPSDQARQIELQKEKERLRQIALRSVPVIIGVPTLSPAGPVPILQPPLMASD
jgi:hypothetical protein